MNDYHEIVLKKMLVFNFILFATFSYSQSAVKFKISIDTVVNEISDKFYNVIEEEYLSIEFIDTTFENELTTIKDSIVLSFSYNKSNDTYIATWKLEQCDKVIQIGSFDKNGNAIGDFHTYIPYDSAYSYFEDGLKNGIEYVKNNNLILISSYKNGLRDGIGYSYYYNGESIIVQYRQGKKEGLWMKFVKDEKGRTYLYSSRTYRKDEIKNGKYFTYHSNGEIFTVAKYKSGVVVGKIKIFDVFGKFKAKREYKIK